MAQAPEVDNRTRWAIADIIKLAREAEELYKDTVEQTTVNGGTLKTIRVPTALLANIRDLAERLDMEY